MISISVVVVTFNNQNTIQDCLDTLSESLENFKSLVTVIDNDSHDKTCDIISSGFFTQKFSQFEFIKNDFNVGFTKAVNQGLVGKQADLFLVLNPDVIMKKDTIQQLVKRLEQHPDAGAVAPQLHFADGTIQPSCRTFPGKCDVIFEIFGLSRLFKNSQTFNRWKMPDFDHTTSRYVDQPQGAFVLVRNKVVQQIGHWDERFPMFFSDVDYCKRIYDAGWKILFCAEAFATHLKGHSVYQHRKKMIKTSHQSFVDYFKKYDKNATDRISTFVIAILLKLVLGIRILAAKK